MKIGSLFTGIGGLELGVFNTVASIAPYDNNIEWIAETNGNALKILEHSTMFHGVPNLEDVTEIDWTVVPDVDCITGGTTCRAQHRWRPSETRAHPNRLPKPFTTGSCN